MIRYQRHNSGMFPRLFCDTCVKPIEDKEGFVFWDNDGNTVHAHTGDCSAKLGRTHRFPYSESLVTFLANLLTNTRINPKTLKPDELWDMFGVEESRKALDRGVK
jgi:hypothetical protein